MGERKVLVSVVIKRSNRNQLGINAVPRWWRFTPPLSSTLSTFGSCFLVADLINLFSILLYVGMNPHLKVPKREIFDRSDFPEFYTIKSSWVGDSVVKILTCYFNF